MARRGRPDIAKILGSISQKSSKHLSVAHATFKCLLAHKHLMIALSPKSGQGMFARCSSSRRGYQKRDAFRHSVRHGRIG